MYSDNPNNYTTTPPRVAEGHSSLLQNTGTQTVPTGAGPLSGPQTGMPPLGMAPQGVHPGMSQGMQPVQQMPVPGQPGATAAALPTAPIGGPVNFELMGPFPVLDTEYIAGYLRTQIGRKVKITFLIGTDNITDRSGTLMDVGVSYVIIQEEETDDLMLCDIYSIKFVLFYY